MSLGQELFEFIALCLVLAMGLGLAHLIERDSVWRLPALLGPVVLYIAIRVAAARRSRNR